MNGELKGRILRRARISIGLSFFLLISLIFLDIHSILPSNIYQNGFYFQFVPSLINALGGLNASASGFIAVLLLTILFGRIYCSTLCPLGIIADIAGKMGKGKKRYTKPFNFVRYFLLTISIISLLTGSIIVLNLLDPFSIFGRVANSFIKPAIITMNNLLSYAFEYFGSFALPPYSLKNFPLFIMVFSLLYILFVVLISITRGRLYCNLVCPVGTFLGIVSRISLFKIRIDHSCINCGKCENICKSECIDINNNRIDYDRCVACFNCMTACPVNAVDFARKEKEHTEKYPTHTRREFITILTALLAFLPKATRGEDKRIIVTVPNKIPVPKKIHPIVPPGAKSLDHLLSNCTGCHACISKCPTQVLQPSITEYGLNGLFMPHLDPKTAFCTPNCIECGKICPSGAIKEFTLEEKKEIQLGEVQFIRDNCIPVLQKTDCGACSEHCPTKAVYMVREGKVRIPKIDPKICIGCGACENVCPAKPNKSIFVKPHSIHKKAEKPKVKKQDEIVPEKGIDVFPF